MNPSSAHLPPPPLAAQQHQDALPMLHSGLPPRSHTYPLSSLYHPTPVRGYSTPAPRLHAPPPSQPTPQVYAALYDHLVAHWTVQAQEVAHHHDERAIKRARTLGERSGAEAEEEREGENGKDELTPAEDAEVEEQGMNDSSRRQRQSSLPPPTLTRPESNLRGYPSFAPHPLRRKRSTSSPPSAASQDSRTIPRATSPPPYEAQDHRHSAPSGSSPRPIAPLPSHRRKSSSDALVNVIKSFEVVLQYRAQGWRMLDQTIAMERRSAGMEMEG